MKLDAFALAISCMVGLALAVDYSLLLVSRVREELGEQHGGDVRAAVGRAAAPTIRTVAVAAAAIVVAMAVAAAASPGTGLLAAAIGVSVVAAVSAATAMLVVPSILVLAGPYLGGSAPAGAVGGGISASIARASMRRPVLGLVGAAVLLLACIPILSLRTGAPTAQSLPSDSPARAEYDGVTKAMGAGWTEPFEIVAVTHKGAVTTQPRLAELQRVQRKLAKDPAVRAVLGPGEIAGSAAKLRDSGRKALAAGRGATPRDGGRLRKLDAGVSSAADGVGSLRDSLNGATSAADRVAAGSRDLEGGVGDLKNGINGAGSGARKLAEKLADAGSGASELASRSAAAGTGARSLRDGARSLSAGLAKLAGGARYLQDRLQTRMSSLQAVQATVRAQRRQADDALAAAERSILPTSAVRASALAARWPPPAARSPPTPARRSTSRCASSTTTPSTPPSSRRATPANEAAKLATAVGNARHQR